MIDHDFSNLPASFAGAARELALAVHRREPVLLVGAPGTGKTMIARRAASLIDLDDHARRWIAAEYEAIGMAQDRAAFGRGGFYSGPAPFRAPHHTISSVAMSGEWRRAHPVQCLTISTPRCVCGLAARERDAGHRVSRAGEVTLARFGVLYLDELPEFRRDALRFTQDRMRAMGHTAPMLIASANPCPCGWARGYTGPEHPARQCVCTPATIERYTARTRELAALVGIATTIALPYLDIAALRGPRCPSTAELRREIAAGVTDLEVAPADHDEPSCGVCGGDADHEGRCQQSCERGVA